MHVGIQVYAAARQDCRCDVFNAKFSRYQINVFVFLSKAELRNHESTHYNHVTLIDRQAQFIAVGINTLGSIYQDTCLENPAQGCVQTRAMQFAVQYKFYSNVFALPKQFALHVTLRVAQHKFGNAAVYGPVHSCGTYHFAAVNTTLCSSSIL